MFSTELGELLRGVGFPLGVTIFTGESCDGDRGSLVPQVNVYGAGTSG